MMAVAVMQREPAAAVFIVKAVSRIHTSTPLVFVVAVLLLVHIIIVVVVVMIIPGF